MGKLTLLIGLLLLVPLSMLPFFPQDACYACAFLVPAGASLLMGGLLCLIKRRESISRQTATHSGNLLVLYIWLYSFVMGAIPFVLSGQLTFVQALFESVSGWTTTGLSVVDVESTPTVFLFYRSFMQFCGGLGFVLIMTTVIHEKMARVLYSAEGHPDKLRPTLRETVRVIDISICSSLWWGRLPMRCAGCLFSIPSCMPWAHCPRAAFPIGRTASALTILLPSKRFLLC